MNKPENQDMCIVMVGNLSDGFTAVGPFREPEEAARWCADFIRLGWIDTWIMSLHAQDVMLAEAQGRKVCDECRAVIPDVTLSMANEFHEKSCSLYLALEMPGPVQCPHCLKVECDCSDDDVSPDIGAKG